MPSSAERRLVGICDLLPTHSQRKAANKHLAYLNDQITEREQRGESTQVMRIARDYIAQMIKLSNAVRDAKAAMSGGKNDD